MARLMGPNDANVAGNVHGGVILQLIELAGHVVATRYCNQRRQQEKPVVAATIRVESMRFVEPMHLGELAEATASVVFTSERSLQVSVDVYAENLITGTRRHTNHALVWYVAVHEPALAGTETVSVPQLVPETEEAKASFARGLEMYRARKEESERVNGKRSRDDLPDGFDGGIVSEDPAAKSVSESRAELSQIVLPSDCTTGGVSFGGFIMKLMDSAAGLVCVTHCRTNVVTISLQAMDFHQSVRVGDVVRIVASLVFVSSRSMEVEVVVHAQSLTESKPRHTTTALFNFVSLDKSMRPQAVPPLRFETAEEKAKALEGQRRYEARRASRA
eukprot:CAMPEP_0114548592 /NCGR_PEP_ID=MMETSP0114-20121206/5066_1 /TAXON_ID=31324 /ORGANISM="Goniomonas sp, Strain m" /LENGTH=331 /DNA_ID=CAMNT_0001733197 /DNA_START=60 /DNA_END=1055 /DNA_ORIENTATION=-